MKKRKYERDNSFLKVVISTILILGAIFVLIYNIDFNPVAQPPNNITSELNSVASEEPTSVPTATPTTPLTPTPTVAPTAAPTPEPTAIPQKPKELTIHQINVSCANAYLLTYGDKVIFIDGGQSKHLKLVKKYLAQVGIDRIDAYICTHWHGDHDDNMEFIVNTYGDENTLVLGPSEKAKGKKLTTGKYAQFSVDAKLTIGELSITCVGPYELSQGGACNYDSLNFVIEYGDFKAFFTGDYVHSKQVMASYSNLIADCDVFQMPHHGLDPIYISEAALKHVSPKTILVPANSSGPTKKMVKKCSTNSTVYDNSNGNIVVTTDGTTYSVKTSK